MPLNKRPGGSRKKLVRRVREPKARFIKTEADPPVTVKQNEYLLLHPKDFDYSLWKSEFKNTHAETDFKTAMHRA